MCIVLCVNEEQHVCVTRWVWSRRLLDLRFFPVLTKSFVVA